MITRQTISRAASALIACAFIASSASASSISLTSAIYEQNFNTMTDRSAVPVGWSFLETDINLPAGGTSRADMAYTIDAGGSTTGDTYSYGASGHTDRAFGMLRSNTLASVIGAQFINDTGAMINSLTIGYTGEMWRAGVSNRNPSDRLDFQFSTDASSWTDYDSLDFSSPNTNTAAGALNGNAASNRTSLSSLISNLSIASGASFWIRWSDFSVSNADDGLAIDDFSITAGTVPEPGSLALLGLGLLGLAASRRRQR